MSNIFKMLIWMTSFLLCLSCNKENDGRLTEKANIEGQANAEGQRKTEAVKALEMERDLETRQRFYQALSGTFNGNMKTELNTGEVLDVNVRFTFIPNLPPYRRERSRTVDEILFDSNNLFLTVEVLHFDPKDNAITFHCVFERVYPDRDKGIINLIKDGCHSLFILQIFEADPTNSTLDLKLASEKLSKEILNGQKSKIEVLKGIRHSTKTRDIFAVSVKRQD